MHHNFPLLEPTPVPAWQLCFMHHDHMVGLKLAWPAQTLDPNPLDLTKALVKQKSGGYYNSKSVCRMIRWTFFWPCSALCVTFPVTFLHVYQIPPADPWNRRLLEKAPDWALKPWNDVLCSGCDCYAPLRPYKLKEPRVLHQHPEKRHALYTGSLQQRRHLRQFAGSNKKLGRDKPARQDTKKRLVSW